MNVSVALNQANFSEKYHIRSGLNWFIEITKI